MEFLVVDTCSLVEVIRGKELGWRVLGCIEAFRYPVLIYSVVTVAEVKTFADRNNWGSSRREVLDKLLSEAIVQEIHPEDHKLMTAYQNVAKESMAGKNLSQHDCWIAATAISLGATLITTDKDFSRLSQGTLKLITLFI
jgi:predicted nucleic acid-binding protein